jgi:hypothetical protein
VGTALGCKEALAALSLPEVMSKIPCQRLQLKLKLKLKNFDLSTKDQKPNPSFGGDQETNDQLSIF